MKQLMVFLVILITGSSLSSAEPAPEEDYQLLQGKWFRNATDGKGAPIRIEQEISQKISKVKIYNRDGKLVHSQQAKFRLQRVDELSLFIYYDIEVLEGPKKGAKSRVSQPCVYRLRGDQLVVVEGIVNGDKFPSLILSWWKIKPPITSTAT
ncbi:hypothetical protein [uncultured Gimesia sp.]|uniref:hypothetical protein n=1 Tax=uncultured Gimesia sp. TaxID=1678688 RepID=UPI0026282AEA|nr:hypothetical protein [uncultured Gimesia sp.]